MSLRSLYVERLGGYTPTGLWEGVRLLAAMARPPKLRSEDGPVAADSRERHESRFIEPWVEAGLPRLEAETAVDALIATFVTLALKARRGEIDDEQAIDLLHRAQASRLTDLDNTAPGD